jgi:hypothetical protein
MGNHLEQRAVKAEKSIIIFGNVIWYGFIEIGKNMV